MPWLSCKDLIALLARFADEIDEVDTVVLLKASVALSSSEDSAGE